MSVVGRTYLERGEPVEVLAQWRGPSEAVSNRRDLVCREVVLNPGRRRRSGPRNVLIRRADGELVVRPFRGLRRPS